MSDLSGSGKSGNAPVDRPLTQLQDELDLMIYSLAKELKGEEYAKDLLAWSASLDFLPLLSFDEWRERNR